MKQKKHKIKQDIELWKKLDTVRSSVDDFKNNVSYKKVRSELAALNYPIVLKLSELMHHKYHETDKDDLKGFGSLGLLDAIDKFDPYKDIQFETFATYRIFGSMYDEMRKLDWVPRLTRQRYSKVEKVRERFITSYGRSPTREEMISIVPGDSTIEKEKAVDDSVIKLSYSINKLSSNSEEDYSSIHTKIEPPQFSELERKEFFISKVSTGLTMIEAEFVYLVYYENRSLKEASKMLNIKDSKSSSLHESALKKLKETFKDDKELLVR